MRGAIYKIALLCRVNLQFAESTNQWPVGLTYCRTILQIVLNSLQNRSASQEKCFSAFMKDA